MDSLVTAALQYKQSGLSIIAVTSDKKSLYKWKEYQNIIIPDKTILKALTHPKATGIAIVCGPVSGNLEVIDIDSKNDPTKTMFDRYIGKLFDKSPILVDSLVIATTKNKGYHLIYRCPHVEKSIHLAKRPTTDTEKSNNHDENVKVLIETRGIGGYVIVHPTPGYNFMQHNLKHIPLITPEHRKLLFDTARGFNQYIESKESFTYPVQPCIDPGSPFYDYDSRGDIIGLLQQHGWKVAKQTPVKTYFLRPGNSAHVSSGDYHHKLGLFMVFSTSTEFKALKGYRPHAVYAVLECGSNFILAAKKLLAEGYGVPYNRRR